MPSAAREHHRHPAHSADLPDLDAGRYYPIIAQTHH